MSCTETMNGKTGIELQKKLQSFKDKCREFGLRVTPQRQEIYEVLVESKAHPTAEMVYHKVREIFPNISMGTVYRTLLTLTEIGAAFIIESSGNAKRFEGNMSNHQHFKCLKCKKIVDLFSDPMVDIKVPTSIRKYKVFKKTVYFEGLCDKCSKGSTARK